MHFVPVTRPFVPPLEEVTALLGKVWESRWLTNDGPLAQELERSLAEVLNVEHALLVNNATLGLIVALKALDLPAGAEVITTPFTFIASTQAISWCGLTPVFADVDPATGTLDSACVEQALTPRTKAILDVHVYGIPAHNDALKALAGAHGLKLVYDACHAMGAYKDDESLARWGDISVYSLHATKLIHSGEGGLLCTRDEALARKIRTVRNFGMEGAETIAQLGINAKMSEVNAAVGLACLPYMDKLIAARKERWDAYQGGLAGIAGLELLHPQGNCRHAYYYAPLRVTESLFGMDRDAFAEALSQRGVGARKYFHPLTSEFELYRGLASSGAGNLPQATRLGRDVLCLPLFHDLPFEAIAHICELVRATCGMRKAA